MDVHKEKSSNNLCSEEEYGIYIAVIMFIYYFQNLEWLLSIEPQISNWERDTEV